LPAWRQESLFVGPLHSSAQAAHMDIPGGLSASTTVTEPPRSPLPESSPPLNKPSLRATSSKTSAATASANGTAPQTNPCRALGQDKVVSNFWLTHADQIVFALLAAVMLVLVAAYWVRLTKWGTVPVEIEHLNPRQPDFRLDMNSATWVEWGQLDGIGDALAHRIVADREEHGQFNSIDDLRRVKGIGPKTLERLRPWLTIESPPRNEDNPSSHRARSGS
jgi:competence protein ComEA